MHTNFNTIHLLHAIREIPNNLINHHEKYLLTVLLSCMNEENQTWYSMDMIAHFACRCERKIRAYIHSLAQKKFISIEKPTVYGRRKTNQYSLNIELIMSFHLTRKGDQKSSFTEERGTNGPKKGDQRSEKRGTKSPIKKETEERKEEGAGSGSEAPPPPPEPAGAPESLRRLMRKIAPTHTHWH